MADMYMTPKIKGWKYGIEEPGEDSFVVCYEGPDDDEPLRVQIKVTSKHRVFMQTWYGVGPDSDSEYFTDPDDLDKAYVFMRDAKDLLMLTTPDDIDKEDLDYEVMCFVGRVLEEFTNLSLNEHLEEVLKL